MESPSPNLGASPNHRHGSRRRENVYLQRPTLSFGDAAYDFSPLPATFLPPPPPEFIDLPPPPPPGGVIRLADAGLHARSGMGSSGRAGPQKSYSRLIIHACRRPV